MISKSADETRRHFENLLGPASVSFHLPLVPVPASRPRVTRNGGCYHLPRYAKFLTAGKTAIRSVASEPTDAAVVVHIDNVMPCPKATRRSYPGGDVDNLAKGTLDIMTTVKKFFADDSQVVGLSVWKRYAEPEEKPGIYVSLFLLNQE